MIKTSVDNDEAKLRGPSKSHGKLPTIERKKGLPVILSERPCSLRKDAEVPRLPSLPAVVEEQPKLRFNETEDRNEPRPPPKLFPNRVHVPWYRRFVGMLEGSEAVNSQPFKEIEQRDLELAMQMSYGVDYEKTVAKDDLFFKEKQDNALSKYRKQQEKTSQQGSGDDMHDRLSFGFSAKDQEILTPIVNVFRRLHVQKAIAWNIRGKTSSWAPLKKPGTFSKLKQMGKNFKRYRTRKRFRNAIKAVAWSNSLIKQMSILSQSTDFLMTNMKRFEQELRERQKLAMGPGLDINVFDVSKYSRVDKPRDTVSMEIKMILTKDWHMRTTEEIDMVVNAMMIHKAFSRYPVRVQRQIATVAWYRSLERGKMVIRQNHIAAGFYFLISGRAMMAQMIPKNSDGTLPDDDCIFKSIKWLEQGDVFGNENMAEMNPLRKFSVISCSKCELLSINFLDYNSHTLSHTRLESAPEHIRYLRKFQFMSRFPAKKLMFHAHEHVFLLYFNPKMLVVPSIANSDFIFVVRQGQCRLLVENPPPKHSIKMYKKIKDIRMKSQFQYDNVIRMNVDEGSMSSETKSASNPQSLMDEVIGTPGHQKQLHSLDAKRHMVAHHVKSKLNSVMGYTKPQVRVKLKSLMDTVVDRVIKHDSHAMEYHGEIEVLENKTRIVTKFLNDNFSQEVQKKFFTSNRYRQSGFSNRNENAQEKDQFQKELRENFDGSSEEKKANFDASSHTSSRPILHTPRSSVCEDTGGVKSTALGENTSTTKLQQRAKGGLNSVTSLASVIIDKPLVSKSSSSSLTKLQTGRERKAEEEKDGDIKWMGMGTKTPSIESSIVSSKLGQTDGQYPTITSTWRLLRTLVKGDTIGDEWLDYNDGLYRPPSQDGALVSDGAELIMISREIMMKYLYKKM